VSGGAGHLPTRNAAIGFVVLAGLYLAFVAAYGVNGLWFDDWGFVSLVHAAQTGHLSFGLLWAQHNENRMAIPYLAMLAVALPTHYDTKVVMLLDGVFFVATFGLWLAIVSSYCQRRVTLPLVAVCGVVWFSLADWQNALWGFQLAWYLILGLLMGMLLLLLNRSPDRPELGRLVGAVAVAVVASYSSAQGLLLWPVGLLCLAWGWWGPGRSRARVEAPVWVGAGAVATAVYFVGYAGKGFSPDVLVDSPRLVVESVLANIGNVFPSASPLLGLHEALGAVLLLATGVVSYLSLRDRALEQRGILPLCLLVFAVLFDLSVTTDRLIFGLALSVTSRYTMANLLLPLGLIAYGWSRLPRRFDEQQQRAGVIVIGVLCGALVLVQVVVSSSYGLQQASQHRSVMTTANRIVVNFDRIPPSERGCYEFALVGDAGLVGDLSAIREARSEGLTMFSSDETYRALGLPKVHC
jgi:hypothetical protein